MPDGTETVRMDEFEPPTGRMTRDELKLAVGPAGETVADNCTFPPKPLALDIASLDVPEDAAGTAKDPGFVDIVNPTTRRVKVAGCLSEPFVPVTVIVKKPGALEIMDSVDVAVPPAASVTLAGVSEIDGPACTDVAERVIVPARLFKLVKVRAEVAVDPAWIEIPAGFAVSVKSGPTVRGIWSCFETPVPVAVTAIVCGPTGVVDGTVILRVELALAPFDSVTLDGLREAVGPFAGDIVAEREMVPEKPALLTLTDEVAEEFVAMSR